MHYYKRNLGDYAKKTGRLTMLQHGAYTLLIDSCYDREIFPTLEQAIDWTWASTEAEVDAVKFVLNRFFMLHDDGRYVQDRILTELLNYQKNADINKRIADEREAKRRANNTKRVQIVDEATPNQEPITTNHKPIKDKATIVATPKGVSDSVWQEFKTLRKVKKAPITQRAIDSITNEANKAGWTLEKALEECIVRGWQAFKSDWVATKANPADIGRITVPPSNEPDKELTKIIEDQKKTRPPTPEELAIFNSIRKKA